MTLDRLITGLHEPKAAVPFLLSEQGQGTLTAEEAFFGWALTLPRGVSYQAAAANALKKLEAITEPSTVIDRLIELFRQAAVISTVVSIRASSSGRRHNRRAMH
jgi:hypothetical protein